MFLLSTQKEHPRIYLRQLISQKQIQKASESERAKDVDEQVRPAAAPLGRRRPAAAREHACAAAARERHWCRDAQEPRAPRCAAVHDRGRPQRESRGRDQQLLCVKRVPQPVAREGGDGAAARDERRRVGRLPPREPHAPAADRWGRHAEIYLVVKPEYLDQFTLVIATQLDEAAVKLLGELCLKKKLPLLIVHSHGLLGYFRLQVAQHAILDSKNDPPIHELRLSKPFPALQKYVDEFDLESLSSIEHAHVPFVAILLKAAEAWKAQHDGKLPSTFPEKAEFKKLIQSMAKGPAGHEVNFIEATDNAYKAYVSPLVPDEVAQVLVTARQLQLTSTTPEFWLLARSLADFVDANDGVLPITGVVPDMTASTETYVALQQVYVTKAKEDATAVLAILQKHLTALQLPADYIATDKVDAFCKNAYNIGMLDTKTIAQELKAADLSAIDLEDEDQKQSPLIWYFLIRALTAFISEFKRHPGSLDELLDTDAQWLLAKAKELAGVSSSELADLITEDHAKEITRSCEVELHNIAAIMGGVASQEAIKIITHQFVPLNHTYLFNGIAGIAAAYDL